MTTESILTFEERKKVHAEVVLEINSLLGQISHLQAAIVEESHQSLNGFIARIYRAKVKRDPEYIKPPMFDRTVFANTHTVINAYCKLQQLTIYAESLKGYTAEAISERCVMHVLVVKRIIEQLDQHYLALLFKKPGV